MATWTPFPHTKDFVFDSASVKKQWKRLHACDQEPLPTDKKILAAWALFHSGHFQKAAIAGLGAGPAGISIANKATCIYANYLERNEKVKFALFMEVAERAAQQAKTDPDNANAYFWQGYALGRYAQSISVAKALALGLGGKIKAALEMTLRLQPQHASAYIALGAFHAEVIDKVGSLIANMTYGAKRETSLQLLQQGLALTPDSPIALLEYANAMVMLDGDACIDDATRLYEQVASLRAHDAMEQLDVEMAQAELAS